VKHAWAVARGLVRAMLAVLRLAPLRVSVPATGSPANRSVGRGRYRLLAAAGAGGAATLHVAHDDVLDRTVAVKLLRFGYDEAARARLQAEARVAAGLSHPALAHVLDYGEEVVDGEPSPYLVMEYVHGVTLCDVLRDGPLPAEQVADLVAQLADALTAVHAAGVVHRDVKPANIMLTPAGQAVLLDFGVARRVDAEPLTQTGTIVGTLSYLSPEQAAGEAATPLSDLYSLGMVAYEALTGNRAVVRETQAATLLAHLTGVVEPLPIDVPAGLRTLVEQLVRRDPQERPADAAVVARLARAEAAISSEPQHTTGQRSEARRRVSSA